MRIFLFFVILLGCDQVRSPLSPSSLGFNEFEKTEAILLSEWLFQDYPNTLKFIDLIVEAGAKVFLMVSNPLNENERKSWRESHGLQKYSENQLELLTISHTNMWLRDFGPFFSIQPSSILHRKQIVNFKFRSEMLLDDTVRYQLGLYWQESLLQVPLRIDGGSLISDGKTCITTEFIELQGNVFANDRQNPKIIESLIKESLGCSQVIVLKNAPHEHVDMYAQFLGKSVVMLGEIEQQTLDHLSSKEASQKVKEQLEGVAEQIKPFVKTVRVPMPAIDATLMRTYTNGIIVNRLAIVPRFQKNLLTEKPYIDSSLMDAYEKKVEKTIRGFGFDVEFLEADDLILRGGALHCVTSHVPFFMEHVVATP